MLKEIKTKYATNCAKCKREIKEGWTVFFNPDNKKIYCKPCGTPMQKAQADEAKKNPKTSEPSKSAGMELLEDLIAQARFNSDLLASLDDKVRDLILDVSHLDSYIRDSEFPARLFTDKEQTEIALRRDVEKASTKPKK